MQPSDLMLDCMEIGQVIKNLEILKRQFDEMTPREMATPVSQYQMAVMVNLLWNLFGPENGEPPQ